MKTRPSGLGGVFAVLDTGLKIRLEKCTECGRLILDKNWLEFPPGIRATSLDEMESAGVDISFGYCSNGTGLSCKVCVDKSQEEIKNVFEWRREFLSKLKCPIMLYVATKCD